MSPKNESKKRKEGSSRNGKEENKVKKEKEMNMMLEKVKKSLKKEKKAEVKSEEEAEPMEEERGWDPLEESFGAELALMEKRKAKEHSDELTESDEEEEVDFQRSVRVKKDQGNDRILNILVPPDPVISRRPERFMTVHHRPPPVWPEEMTAIQKKEVVFFQRKMRAFRNMKNHLLTSSLVELENEALLKNWGEIPRFVRDGNRKYYKTHLEVLYAHWPEPFEFVEKLWLRRHFVEFSRAWEVPNEMVVSSPLLTPFMKYMRCFPSRVLLSMREVIPPDNVPDDPLFGLPITGTNLITDAKAMLTHYGMHRLKDWEVHDNVDYDMIDFRVLFEETQEAVRIMFDKLRRYRCLLAAMRPHRGFKNIPEDD